MLANIIISYEYPKQPAMKNNSEMEASPADVLFAEDKVMADIYLQ